MVVTLTTPFKSWFVVQKLGLNIVYMCAKFDDSSFNRSRDIIWPLTTPLLRVICRPYAGIYYSLPVYKI